MTILDRVKSMTSLVINVPSDVEKLSVIIEKKTATAASALKREAAALEKAVTPEFEAELEKLEGLLSKIPGLSDLVKAHDVVEETIEHVASDVEAEFKPAASDAVPTAPIL